MTGPFEAYLGALHFPKIPSQGLIFEPEDDCRLRGVSGNAQDTPPFRGSFRCVIKTLSSFPAVSPLSAFLEKPFFFNKNNGWAV